MLICNKSRYCIRPIMHASSELVSPGTGGAMGIELKGLLYYYDNKRSKFMKACPHCRNPTPAKWTNHRHRHQCYALLSLAMNDGDTTTTSQTKVSLIPHQLCGSIQTKNPTSTTKASITVLDLIIIAIWSKWCKKKKGLEESKEIIFMEKFSRKKLSFNTKRPSSTEIHGTNVF